MNAYGSPTSAQGTEHAHIFLSAPRAQPLPNLHRVGLRLLGRLPREEQLQQVTEQQLNFQPNPEVADGARRAGLFWKQNVQRRQRRQSQAPRREEDDAAATVEALAL